MNPTKLKNLATDALVIAAACIVLVPALGLYQAIHPGKTSVSATPATFGLDYEPVSLTAADGTKIAGWFIPRTEGPAGSAVIVLHGYPAEKSDLLPRAVPLARDHDVLMIDFRYFGESGGSYTTVGALETDDLLAAVDHLKQRGHDRIGVYGFSMGGAVALMTLDRTDDIAAVASEGAYAELSLMAEDLYRYYGPLRRPMARITGLYSRVFLGIDPRQVSPAASAGRTDRPVLIIHSRGDQVVPFANAERLQAALAGNPLAEFDFQDGGHGETTAGSQDRIREFFSEHLQ